MKFFIFLILIISLDIKNLYAKYREPFATITNVLQFAVPLYSLGYSIFSRDKLGIEEFSQYYFTTVSSTYVIKYATHRKRRITSNYDSFPSGHTASAFTGTWFLWQRYGYKTALITMPFSILTGYYRIFIKAHYPSDVLGAIALTWISSYLLISKYDNQNISLSYNTNNKTFLINYYIRLK